MPYVAISATDATRLGLTQERSVTFDGKVTTELNGGIVQWHLKPGRVARVPYQKYCDRCKYDLGNGEIPAFADARPKNDGTWGNFCIQCFVELECTLGTGFGQVLLVRPND